MSKITSSFTSISISPVAIFGFLLSLSDTIPLTAKTYSDLISLALLKISSPKVSLTTICDIPVVSLKSININEPKLRSFATQPIKVTSLPISSFLKFPHICVLLKFPICAILSSL